MPTIMTCEICGEPGAKTVQASLTIIGEVIEGQPTGTSEAVDACAKCRPAALKMLFQHVQDEFEEQVPFHDRLLAHVATLEELRTAARETAQPLLAHASRYEEAGLAVPPADKELVTAHQANVQKLDAEEGKRRKTLATATAKSDKHKSAFRKALTD